MEPIKVLIVDDSVVIRRLLTAVLDEPADMQVVGYSTNGKLALERIEQLKPDIVSLDVMMPVMNGIECMVEIRKRFGDLPVVMFSSLTEEGAAVTMEALDAGANDFVAKPAHTEGFADSVGKVSQQLIGKLRAHAAFRKRSNEPKAPLPQAAVAAKSLAPIVRIDKPKGIAPVSCIIIGSSTGGPNALNELFSNLPKNINVPIVITQHMPPMFTRLLAERLENRSGYVCKEAVHGEVVKPGEVRIAPGDFHMGFRRQGTNVLFTLDQKPQVHSCRPAVDPMMESACKVWGSGLLAVVLTGMGCDGADGCVEIAKSGGHVIAQDEATSVVWGMPGAVVHAGAADSVLPLKEIAGAIGQHLVLHGPHASKGVA